MISRSIRDSSESILSSFIYRSFSSMIHCPSHAVAISKVWCASPPANLSEVLAVGFRQLLAHRFAGFGLLFCGMQPVVLLLSLSMDRKPVSGTTLDDVSSAVALPLCGDANTHNSLPTPAHISWLPSYHLHLRWRHSRLGLLARTESI